MKELSKKLHLLILCFSLIWSLPGLGDVRSSLKIKEISTNAFVLKFEQDFHRGIDFYNKNRNDLGTFAKRFNSEEKKYLLRFYRANRISSLPKWIPKGEGYELSYNGNTLYLSPRLAYQSKFLVNEKVFTIKSSDPNEIEKAFRAFMKTKRNFSFLNLFVDEANAGICGGICIAILFAAVIGGGLATADSGFSMLKGDRESLDVLLAKLKEKSGQCTKETRAQRFQHDSVVPGEQETWDDMKKISERIDTRFERNNKKLHPYVLKEVLGVNVSSCKEFAQLWSKKAGALAKRDQRSSLSAYENAKSSASSKEREVCKVVDRYSDCLANYKKESLTFNGERRYEGDYNSETGKFGEESLWEKAKSAVLGK